MLLKLLIIAPFLTIYSALHWLLIRRFYLAGITGRKSLAALGIWSLCMVLGMILVIRMDFISSTQVKGLIGWVVHTWLAFILLFTVWSHVLRVFRSLGDRLFRAGREPSWRLLSQRQELWLHLAVTLGVLFYGMCEASLIRVEKREWADSRVPPGTRLRLAFIVDLHLGLLDNMPRMERLVTVLESARPDLLLAGGDMTDVHMHDMASMSQLLNRIPASAGKFAVTGNHEWYAGVSESRDFLKAAGFTVLQDTSQEVNSYLTVVGFDDPEVRGPTGRPARDAEVLRGIAPSQITVVLRHQPTISTDTVDLFDLQLSGHTHSGQIWPVIYFTVAEFGFWPGLTRVGNRSWLYLSRGTATFGPQVRLFAPPEVTIMDFVHIPASATDLR